MAPARISEGVVTEIEALWVEGRGIQSGLAVWREYHKRNGHRTEISKRKVQQIIANAKNQMPDSEAFPLVEWRPWTDEGVSAHDNDQLLQLDAACSLAYQRHLYQHEAAWGRRLRVALTGLNIRGQLAIINEYGLRERLASHFDRPEGYTADLDGLVTYKPWLSDNRASYYYALTIGAIKPLVGSITQELYEEFESGLETNSSIRWMFTLQAFAQREQVPGSTLFNSLNFDMPSKFYERDMTEDGFEFNIPSSRVYDPAETNFETPDDFLEWLRLTVLEFWAGRSPVPETSETAGEQQ